MKRIAIIMMLISSLVPMAVSAQSTLTVTPLSQTAVILNWYHWPLSTGFYTVYREGAAGSCNPTPSSTSIIAIITSSPDMNHTYTDHGLTSGTSYCYAVKFQSNVYGHESETEWFGPSIGTTLGPATATPTLASTPTATSTRTPTPTGTVTITATPVPYIPATIAPPTLQILSNQCIVLDYHFMMTVDSPWNKSQGVTWSYSRYALSQTASINQVVAFPAAGEYVASIRASSPITPAIFHVGIFSDTFNVTTNKTTLSSYAITITVPNTSSGIIRITAPITTNLIVDRICILSLDQAQAQGFGGGNAFIYVDPAGNLDLADFESWFTPLELTPMFSNPFSGVNWDVTMGQVARIAMTLMVIAMPNVLQYYFAGRVAILALAWFFGFVAKRIGHPLPGGETQVVVMGRNTGMYVPKHLPSLGPSVLRGGRRGRSRGLPRL